MPTSAEIALAGVGAFAASEATGVTDVTGLGGGGGSGSDDTGGGGSSPGLGVVMSQLAGLRGAVASSGDVEVPDVSGVTSGEVADLLAPLADAAAEPNANVADTTDDVTDFVRDPRIPTIDGGGSGGGGVGGGGGGGVGTGDVIGAVANFDPSNAGRALGRGTGDFINSAARGAGQGVGRSPFSFADAAGAGVLSGAGDLVNNSVERGERVAENTLSALSPGEGRPATTQEVISGEADLSDATFGPLKWGIDAVNNADLGGAVSDLTDDGRLDEPVLGSDDGTTGGDPASGVTDSGDSARNAARAVATAGSTDTTSSGDTTEERDRELPEGIERLRR